MKTPITAEELNEWFALRGRSPAKDAAEPWERDDYRQLVRLNHLVMEASHEIHNDNMT